MPDPFISLHKYFTWATRFRRGFNDALAHVAAASETPNPDHAFVEDLGFNMSYWYASMYVVVEGYRELALTDPAVDALLASPNVDLLKRYRHGVFHFQKDYWDPRFINFMNERGTAKWAVDLSSALGAFFLRELDARKAQPQGEPGA